MLLPESLSQFGCTSLPCLWGLKKYKLLASMNHLTASGYALPPTCRIMHPLRHFSLSLGHTGLALCSWEISCYLTSLKACLRFSPCLSPTLVAVSLYQAMVTALSRIRSGFICSFDRLVPAVWPQSCCGSIRYVMYRTRSALPGNTVYWLSADSSSSCLHWLNLLIQSFALHVMHFKLCLHHVIIFLLFVGQTHQACISSALSPIACTTVVTWLS